MPRSPLLALAGVLLLMVAFAPLASNAIAFAASSTLHLHVYQGYAIQVQLARSLGYIETLLYVVVILMAAILVAAVVKLISRPRPR